MDGRVGSGRKGKSGLTVEGEALALVPAVVLGQEELEVVVRVFDGADFVDVVDEVARGGHALGGRRLRRDRMPTVATERTRAP
jgi:hypothetical protein